MIVRRIKSPKCKMYENRLEQLATINSVCTSPFRILTTDVKQRADPLIKRRTYCDTSHLRWLATCQDFIPNISAIVKKAVRWSETTGE